MPRTENLKNVPPDELEDTVKDYREAGAEVETTEQDDGNFTVKAIFPDKKKGKKSSG